MKNDHEHTADNARFHALVAQRLQALDVPPSEHDVATAIHLAHAEIYPDDRELTYELDQDA